MLTANDIQQILSGSGAIAQDIDGTFLLFTDEIPASTLSFSDNLGPTAYEPELFTPTFFDLSAGHQKNFRYGLKFERKLLISLLSQAMNEPVFEPLPTWQPADEEAFRKDFQSIKSAIHEGFLQKAVVMTTENSPWSPNSRERVRLLGELLLRAPPNLFIYGFWHETSGVLGATPELLFHRSGRQLATMALAGTLPKQPGANPPVRAQQLLEDPKELYEHRLVVEDLSDKFAALAKRLQEPGGLPPLVVSHRGPQVLELPHLFHLQTPMTVELAQWPMPSLTDRELMVSLHPTSALGLRAPHLTWQWLKSLRGHQHLGHFGAPFGVSRPDGYLCLVGIRNIEWSGAGSSIRAGCGIVDGSQAGREWAELRAKRESVKALLGLLAKTDLK